MRGREGMADKGGLHRQKRIGTGGCGGSRLSRPCTRETTTNPSSCSSSSSQPVVRLPLVLRLAGGQVHIHGILLLNAEQARAFSNHSSNPNLPSPALSVEARQNWENGMRRQKPEEAFRKGSDGGGWEMAGRSFAECPRRFPLCIGMAGFALHRCVCLHPLCPRPGGARRCIPVVAVGVDHNWGGAAGERQEMVVVRKQGDDRGQGPNSRRKGGEHGLKDNGEWEGAGSVGDAKGDAQTLQQFACTNPPQASPSSSSPASGRRWNLEPGAGPSPSGLGSVGALRSSQPAEDETNLPLRIFPGLFHRGVAVHDVAVGGEDGRPRPFLPAPRGWSCSEAPDKAETLAALGGDAAGHQVAIALPWTSAELQEGPPHRPVGGAAGGQLLGSPPSPPPAVPGSHGHVAVPVPPPAEAVAAAGRR